MQRKHVSDASFGAEATGRPRCAVCSGARAWLMPGMTAQAQALTDDLAKRFPEDTIVQFNYLPTTPRKACEFSNGNTSEAIDILKPPPLTS